MVENARYQALSWSHKWICRRKVPWKSSGEQEWNVHINRHDRMTRQLQFMIYIYTDIYSLYLENVMSVKIFSHKLTYKQTSRTYLWILFCWTVTSHGKVNFLAIKLNYNLYFKKHLTLYTTLDKSWWNKESCKQPLQTQNSREFSIQEWNIKHMNFIQII